jgi:hypothetical protein
MLWVLNVSGHHLGGGEAKGKWGKTNVVVLLYCWHLTPLPGLNISPLDLILLLSYILKLHVCLSVCPGSFWALPGPLFVLFLFFFFFCGVLFSVSVKLPGPFFFIF